MEIVLLLIRLLLFGIFAIAGIGKLLDPEGSEKAVKDFGSPDTLAKPLAVALPAVEIAIAVSLLFVQTSWYGGIGSLAIMAVFVGGMLWQISKGKAPNCHCFGQMHSEAVGKKSLIRNIIFALLALVLVLSGRFYQGMSLAQNNDEMLQAVIAVFILTALVVVVLYLKKMLEQQSGIVKRLDLMDMISRDGAAVERDEAGDPHDGLPIGSPFPDFLLADVKGKLVAFEHLLAKAKPLLFIFVSPTCEPCKAFIPEIERWRIELKDKVQIVLISNGTAADNIEKFGPELSQAILLQKKRELADLAFARWTPTALFVGADGTTLSRIAAGETAISDLADKVTAGEVDDEFFYVENGHSHGAKPKIGEIVPDFSLTDLDGRSFDQKYFTGHKTLVAFWSLTCPHCVGMIGELKKWESDRAEYEPKLLMFSEGDIEQHREFGLSSPILIDEKYKVAQKFGMFGTPSAVLVDENGKIVSETASGTTNIWALLGKKK